MFNTCEVIGDTIGALFVCSQIGEYIRIRTPYLYPDGDVVDLFLQEKNGELTLTDVGETLRWLQGQSPVPRRSKRQQQLITDVIQTEGVDLFKGRLIARVSGLDQLSAQVVRLGQASIRVADIWFTLRNQSFESIADEVEELLIDEKIQYERNVRLIGRSTRQWTINFRTFTQRRSSLISVLSTGSRGATRQLTNNVMAAWVDLSHYQASTPPYRFISLFDDTTDIWDEDDIKLLADFSEVVFWSTPSELIAKIAA